MPLSHRDVRFHSCWSSARSADVFAMRSADVSDWGTARLLGSGQFAPRHRTATVACSMPASVYSRVAQKKKIFTSFTSCSRENGSFSEVRVHAELHRLISKFTTHLHTRWSRSCGEEDLEAHCKVSVNGTGARSIARLKGPGYQKSFSECSECTANETYAG